VCMQKERVFDSEVLFLCSITLCAAVPPYSTSRSASLCFPVLLCACCVSL